MTRHSEIKQSKKPIKITTPADSWSAGWGFEPAVHSSGCYFAVTIRDRGVATICR